MSDRSIDGRAHAGRLATSRGATGKRGRTAAARAVTATLAAVATHVVAATADLADQPLLVTLAAKPNVMFIIDDSGSMKLPFISLPGVDPDVSLGVYPIGETAVGFRNWICNPIAFDPNRTYDPPKVVAADGSITTAPDADFYLAPEDGFLVVGGRKTNLASAFRFIDERVMTRESGGYDQFAPAYYYRFRGTPPTDPQALRDVCARDKFEFNKRAPILRSNDFERVDVTDAATRRNFANWYSYYRTRMLVTKTAASNAFATLDERVRVGFMTINSGIAGPNRVLPVRDFTPTVRKEWFRFLHDTVPTAATPLPTALARAGLYFAGRPDSYGTIGPSPITSACQANFAILHTDGQWNQSTPIGLDGQPIGDTDGDLARPFRDDGRQPWMLADVAQHYWENDLRPDMPDRVPPRVVGSMRDDNPRQHMVTITIGLGLTGKLEFDPSYLETGGGDYAALVAGTKVWGNNVIDDLWHAAVNGRGRAYLSEGTGDLQDAFLGSVSGLHATLGAGAGASYATVQLSASGNVAYGTSYSGVRWSGDVRAFDVGAEGLPVDGTPPRWSAARALAATPFDTRRIFTANAAGNGLRSFEPSSFSPTERDTLFLKDKFRTSGTWARMSPAQRSAVGSGGPLVDFLRGDRSREDFVAGNANRLFRKRDSALGDIVNSRAVYVKAPQFEYAGDYAAFKAANATRPAIVLAGANDGMLHAFHAEGTRAGQEAWAFVPSQVLGEMWRLADVDYAHRYYVDGSPVVADVRIDGTWRTIVVGGFNKGGAGWYALDITDTTNPKFLWELAKGPCTQNVECNLGFSYGNPVIGKLRSTDATEGRWVVMVASGYNNTTAGADGGGWLYVLDAARGQILHRIPTGAGTPTTPSNLAMIAGWVENARTDATIERVYGGDMLGNVWRFDVNDTIGAPGREAVRLAVLTSPAPDALPQPVTTRPELASIDGVPMVYVATGRTLGATDVLDKTRHSVYALRDPLDDANPVWATPRQYLRPITLESAANGSTRTTSAGSCGGDCAAANGWYIDLESGERVDTAIRLQAGVLVFASNRPRRDDCGVTGESWLNYVGADTGLPLGGETRPVSLPVASTLGVGLSMIGTASGALVGVLTGADTRLRNVVLPAPPVAPPPLRRINWREVLE